MVVNAILLTLHVCFATVAFGAALTAPSLVRRSLELGGDAMKLAAGDAAKRVNMSGGAAGGTLVLGVILIFYRGGMGAISPSIHIALTLMLGFLGVIYGLARPATKRLVAAADAGDAAAAGEALSGMSRFLGIGHLLWLVMLVLMFYRF
jgi:hypothetical protein